MVSGFLVRKRECIDVSIEFIRSFDPQVQVAWQGEFGRFLLLHGSQSQVNYDVIIFLGTFR